MAGRGCVPGLPTDTADELGHALVLADLLAEDAVPGPRPPRPADSVDEVTSCGLPCGSSSMRCRRG